MTSKHLTKWFVTTVSNQLTHVLIAHTILYVFSVTIQRSISFANFSSLTRMSNISMRKTLKRIRKSYSFGEIDLKHEITLEKNLLRVESKLPVSLEQVFSFTARLLKKLRLIVTGSCNSFRHERFMREKFSKKKLVKTIPKNSMINKRLGNIDLLSVERYELKNRFR